MGPGGSWGTIPGQTKGPQPPLLHAQKSLRDYNVSSYMAICDVIHALNHDNFHTSIAKIVTAEAQEAQACGKSPFIINWSPFCLRHAMSFRILWILKLI